MATIVVLRGLVHGLHQHQDLLLLALNIEGQFLEVQEPFSSAIPFPNYYVASNGSIVAWLAKLLVIQPCIANSFFTLKTQNIRGGRSHPGRIMMITSLLWDGRQPVVAVRESTPRQGSRSVSDTRRQAGFSILCITCRLSLGKGSPSFPIRFRSNPRTVIPVMQGQLLNHAPPVPNAFIGVPVSLQVPPRSRALVPTLDRDYCDHTRHLLTYYTSRTAPASGFRPGEIPKSLGVLM